MAAEMNGGESSEKVTREEWKPIKGYEGFYEISNFGRVRSLDSVFYQRHYSGCMAKHKKQGKIMKLHIRPNGYLAIGLRDKDGHQKSLSIHRLVALHFLDKPEGKDYINHLDANPKNNRVDNLEWCTQSHNIQYAYDNGTKTPPGMKKVNQYDMAGNYIRTWESVTQAERTLHINNVGAVCRGVRNYAGGCKWQYTE